MDAKHPDYSGEIFDLWDTYHKVVVRDFMAHRALGVQVEEALRATFAGRDYSLLDLGCGDASVFAQILKRVLPSSYRGVDLSEKALELAAANLRELSCPVELVQSDKLSALADAKSYDAIHSSFVLHHLSTEEKAEFFRRAARALEPGGLLLLVDTVRGEDETLDDYLRHYLGWIDADWEGTLRHRERCDLRTHHDERPPRSSLCSRRAGARGGTGAAA